MFLLRLILASTLFLSTSLFGAEPSWPVLKTNRSNSGSKVFWTQNSDFVVDSGDSSGARLIQLSSQKVVAEVKGVTSNYAEEIDRIAVSPKKSKRIDIYSLLSTPQLLRTIDIPISEPVYMITDLQISPNGSHVIATVHGSQPGGEGEKRYVWLIKVSTGEIVVDLGPLTGGAFQEGQYLFDSANDRLLIFRPMRYLRMIDLNDAQTLWEKTFGTGGSPPNVFMSSIWAKQFSLDGQNLFLLFYGSLAVLDSRTGDLSFHHQTPQGTCGPQWISVTPVATYVSSCGDLVETNGSVAKKLLFDLNAGGPFIYYTKAITAGHDGKNLYVFSEKQNGYPRQIFSVDPTTKKPALLLEEELRAFVEVPDISKDGRYLRWTAFYNDYIIDLNKGQVVLEIY